MSTTYTKSLASDFSNTWNQTQFRDEIVTEVGITPVLTRIDASGDIINIVFEYALDAGEITLLNTLITNHIPVDPPKLIIESDGTGNTTATLRSAQTGNRTITLPDADDTLVGTLVSQTLTNKKLVTASTEIVDDGDNSKKISFNAASANSSTSTIIRTVASGNRTITLPDTDDTLVGQNDSVTLTNKTFKDASTVFEDNSDTSKQLKFLLDGSDSSTLTTFATSSTANRTLTLPDTTDTLATLSGTEILQNKSFLDPGTFFIDNADNTKKMQFEISGVTTGNTRVLTIPDGDTTLVGTGLSQTLTNKIINTANNTLTIAAGDIGSGTFANARISATNITQHEGSITHQNLSGAGTNTHAQIDSHLSATTAHGVTGAVVGTTNSQTFTNKTITATSNNVAAKSLHSATTIVNVASATAPSSGQVLTATSGTAATWQTPSSGGVSGPGSSIDQGLIRFNGTGGSSIEGVGVRHYGASATNPVSPTPSAGDEYYNTSINEKMIYDASRGKWLSITGYMDGCGINGTTAAGTFFRRWNGMTYTTTRGPYLPKGTIVYIGYGHGAATTITLEILIDGVVVAELASGGAASASSDTINADFPAGVLSIRNKAGSAGATYLQATVHYKKRV